MQPSGPGRVFKGLGVAKRYCSRDSIGNTFVRWGQVDWLLWLLLEF